MTTSRLELVPATLTLIEAELNSNSRLASALGAHVPDDWPPGEYDRPAIEYFRAKLSANPEHVGWYGWYAILRPTDSEPATLVGAGGYFGPPVSNDVVEIGYSVVHSFKGRGYATELVRALVEYAFATGRVKRIVAHTTPENIGSVKVLEKSGFRFVGSGKDPGTVEYECGHQAG